MHVCLWIGKFFVFSPLRFVSVHLPEYCPVGTQLIRVDHSIQSMTYGRPSMISGPSTISLPEPIDDVYLSTEADQPYGAQPEGVPSKMACFVLGLRLSNIISRLRQYVNELPSPLIFIFAC